MKNSNTESFSVLISSIASLKEVQAIGKSGGSKLPERNESDIDIFVFCSEIPALEIRQAKIDQLGEIISTSKLTSIEDRHWGICDYVFLGEMEVCLMYFTTEKMNTEIERVLTGERMEKEDNYFYPIGRCATFSSLHILSDKTGYISSMKQKLLVYPDALSKQLFDFHSGQLDDTEDLERAILRKDILFYHFALDIAIDHFLQALFTLNKCYFPSRKRTLSYIDGFMQKPADCASRLMNVIRLGSSPDTVVDSYNIWQNLCLELKQIALI